jgi:formate dehydrogenase iron-sulfur subunit
VIARGPNHALPTVDDVSSRTLIDRLLQEQSRLTAVERFARTHALGAMSEPRYRALLPAAPPGPGRQLAFEVDLDKCSGCKACVTACHSLNGLDDGEAWREVGELISEDWRRPVRQIVTTACHHCVDPACLEGCPVLAYDKDPVTGVVRHLDDQCIGCQYCVMMCPYDVPKYSKARGIVRKCDLCAQRLAVEEAPACVQACPNEAIRITVVEQEAVRLKFRPREEALSARAASNRPGANLESGPVPLPRANRFLPASPDPSWTLPTTRYVSRQPLPTGLVPGQAGPRTLSPAHWPLVWMLVLTQSGAGLFAALPWMSPGASEPVALCGAVAGLLGLLASMAHLGRPRQAWRSFLGLRRSWLSREILTFSVFLALALALTVMLWGNRSVAGQAGGAGAWAGQAILLGATAGAGLLGVFCSGMVYHATGRAGWRGWRSVGRFAGSAAVFGLGSALWAAAWVDGRAAWLGLLLAAATVVKLAGEHRLLRCAETDHAEEAWPKDGDVEAWSLAQSAAVMRDRLGWVTRVRFLAGVLGGVVLPAAGFLVPSASVLLAGFGFGCCFAGELAERFLFFRAVVTPRMPVP